MTLVFYFVSKRIHNFSVKHYLHLSVIIFPEESTKISKILWFRITKMTKANFKCEICKVRGTKGYFTIPNSPNDQDRRQRWLQAIHADKVEGQEPREVPKTGRVCFRHFAINQIDVQPNLVKPMPGNLPFSLPPKVTENMKQLQNGAPKVWWYPKNLSKGWK